MRKILISLFAVFVACPAFAASVVATIAGRPITDTDVTARVALMNKQGDTSTDNRRRALQNIIDDQIKLEYAANFKAVPSDADVDKELKNMNLGEMSATEKAMAKTAVSANIAWQMIIARTIIPTIEVSADEITSEKNNLEREHGLPIEMTIVRLVDIPANVASKLTKPKNCDAAIKQAEDLGGAPQKFVAAQYELSADIRDRIVGLPELTWSPRKDDTVLLVCGTKKMKEYGKLDDIIKQNSTYKKAMFIADQQLKQLRRKAVIVINDERYNII